MAPKSDDADWIPLTPEAKTASNRREQLKAKADTLCQEKGISNVRTRGKTSKSSKPKASPHVHQKPKILKKRRVMRKRMSLNKLVELTRVIHGLRECTCTALNLSWMNTKRERSNTAIRRTDFSSTFAAHVRVQNESVENLELESDKDIIVKGDVLTDFPPLKVYERRKNRMSPNTWHNILNQIDCDAAASNSESVENVTLEESDKDIIDKGGVLTDSPPLKEYERRKNRTSPNTWHNILNQIDCDAAASNSDDPSCTSFTVPAARSTSEENGCGAAVNTSLILGTQLVVVDEPTTAGKIDECNNSSRVEEDLDRGKDAKVMEGEVKENVDDWITLTPPIPAKHGHSEKDSVKTASNSGQSESLIDILKRKSTHGVVMDKKPSKRMKMKRHRPKVVDPSKPVKPSTPKPRTPKPARKVRKKIDPSEREVKTKVDPLKIDDGEATRKPRKKSCKRKLDFDRECCTMDQEELKPQDRMYSPLEVESMSPKICKKRRMMRQRASFEKLNNLIRMIGEKLPSEYASAIPQLNGKDLKMKRMKALISTYFSTPTQVQEESVQQVLVTKSVEHCKDDAISCNGSIQRCCEKCGNGTDEAKSPHHILDLNTRTQQDNVLLIQDEAFREALADFVAEKMESLSIVDDTSKQLVLSGEKTDPSKLYKAIVDLDPETMKVWGLLMESNWSEATEAEALGDEEYMKGERISFCEKMVDFLSRMRVVHGDRKFSPWKGSIVDSIVGVFLTQNVSDHLSSSAFMALRARYPPLSLSEQNSQFCRDDQRAMLVEPSCSTSEEPNPISQVEQPTKIGNESHSEAAAGDATQGRKKGKRKKKQEKPKINWDALRKQYSHGMSRERTENNADSINWEAVRRASAEELAEVIIDRGMSNQLARRIKGFLDRMVRDHGSIDLEWLRNVPPPKAKDYLMDISGLGLKSTECVRLLALHFPAFPVDTNAGRFFVRVGWVPLKPLPESVQLHLLSQYPILDSIQKYIWPRLCDNEHSLLYQFHCHSITVAKSFCTKTQPNCNECPMRGQCRHYASALASAKLRLEGPQPKSGGDSSIMPSQEAAPMLTNLGGDESRDGDSSIMSSQEAELMLTNLGGDESRDHYNSCNSEPIIEFPPSPVAEPVPMEPLDGDIEDIGCDSEITTVMLNGVDFSNNLHSYMGEDYEISKALVAISPNVGSVPMPKLKQAMRLRTVHQVYELPDSHPLLEKFERREPEDPCPYLLAIWIADEHSHKATTCAARTRLSREVAQYQKHKTIQGTILIPCRTANRGGFPLNGTYFQPNEVFADHESSREPVDVPREWIWNLRRRILYCGTSITSICRGMVTEEVAYCFNRSFICVRGFDTKSRAAKSLARRFHLCKSRESTPKKNNSRQSRH